MDLRKYLATVALGGCVLMASPLEAAPSADETVIEASPTVSIDHGPVRVPVSGLRDEAAMLLVGTALIGLAAAVRRAA